jgi:hypothetical protein
VTDTQKRISERVGFSFDATGGFTFTENGDCPWKASEYREIAETLWRELVSTTERLERISKAAEQQFYQICAAHCQLCKNRVAVLRSTDGFYAHDNSHLDACKAAQACSYHCSECNPNSYQKLRIISRVSK